MRDDSLNCPATSLLCRPCALPFEVVRAAPETFLIETVPHCSSNPGSQYDQDPSHRCSSVGCHRRVFRTIGGAFQFRASPGEFRLRLRAREAQGAQEAEEPQARRAGRGSGTFFGQEGRCMSSPGGRRLRAGTLTAGAGFPALMLFCRSLPVRSFVILFTAGAASWLAFAQGFGAPSPAGQSVTPQAASSAERAMDARHERAVARGKAKAVRRLSKASSDVGR